jgi:hypothetical protein
MLSIFLPYFPSLLAWHFWLWHSIGSGEDRRGRGIQLGGRKHGTKLNCQFLSLFGHQNVPKWVQLQSERILRFKKWDDREKFQLFYGRWILPTLQERRRMQKCLIER